MLVPLTPHNVGTFKEAVVKVPCFLHLRIEAAKQLPPCRVDHNLAPVCQRLVAAPHRVARPNNPHPVVESNFCLFNASDAEKCFSFHRFLLLAVDLQPNPSPASAAETSAVLRQPCACEPRMVGCRVQAMPDHILAFKVRITHPPNIPRRKSKAALRPHPLHTSRSSLRY